MTRGGRERGHRGRRGNARATRRSGPKNEERKRGGGALLMGGPLGWARAGRHPKSSYSLRTAGGGANGGILAGGRNSGSGSDVGTRHPLGARAAPLPPRSGPRLYREVLQTPNLPPPGQETFRSRPPCVYKASSRCEVPADGGTHCCCLVSCD